MIAPLPQSDNPEPQPQQPSIFKDKPAVVVEPAVEQEPEASVSEAAPSFEITFGRVWLARIGIVILLTGLVFLGNLAYQQIVPRLGPGMKLSMIYMAGAALSVAGMFLERKRESLKNYARVVLAGGLATIYYATYAAHFVTPLKVIESPVIGGSLLLGLAVAIGAAAHRRKSETLALIAVVLSYYTAGLNPIGSFTLFSNLLLTGTAVFFLWKHRWVRLALISMAATYLSYVWCRLISGHVPSELGIVAPLAHLAGYWIMFAFGGFVARAQSLSAAARAQLLTANNLAFAGLAGYELSQHRPDLFWAFSLGFGLLLLVLGRVARATIENGRVVEDCLAVQGFALTTLGLATKLTGQQFALTLAAQSVLLLAGSGRPAILRVLASVLSAGGAAFLAAVGMQADLPHAAAVAGFVSTALIGAGVLFRSRVGTPLDHSNSLTAAFTTVAVILGTSATWQATGRLEVGTWLAMGAVACAALPQRFRLRELTLISQALIPAAAALWLGKLYSPDVPSLLQPALIIPAAVGLSLWWARFARMNLSAQSRTALESAMAFAAVAATAGWICHDTTSTQISALSVAVGVVWISASLVARATWLTFLGLAFAALGLGQFAMHLREIHWAVALLPVAHLVFLAWVARFSSRLGTEAEKIGPLISGIAASAAAVLTVPWTFAHIDVEWRAPLFAAEAAITLIAGARRKNERISFAGAGLMTLGWVVALVTLQDDAVWQQLAALIVIPASARFARKVWPADPLRHLAGLMTWASMFGMTVWTLRWCDLRAHQLSGTLIWTFLALTFFAAGLGLKDRHYRLGGLCLLGLAIGRVFFIDVWRLEPVIRILSFIALGTALLLVGYFYNRFEDKLRRWL